MAVSGEPRVSAVSKRKNHVLGVVLIITVAIIWVSAGELVQFIYGKGSHFDKPLFVTYYSTSLLALYLAGFAFTPRWKELLRGQVDLSRSQSVDKARSYIPVPTVDGQASSAEMNVNRDDIGRRYSVYEVFKLGAIFAPLFILSNYTFNMGLKLTSVASSSTISTLSGLFTLGCGAAMGVERFSWFKLCAAIITIGGVALIGKEDEGERQTVGDLLSLAAAFLYALYTTFLKRSIRHENNVDMPMVFAFLGVITLVCWWPLLLLAHYLKLEIFELPDMSTFGYLTLNALVGTLLADYLWARSVVLTTPLISTLALSLTVPFALFADFLLGKERFTSLYVVGVLLVLGGFALVNVDEVVTISTKSSLDQPAPTTFTLVEEQEDGVS